MNSIFQASREMANSAQIESPPIRVLVAEPDSTSRKLISSLLEDKPEITVECVDQSSLIASIWEGSPELVVVDAHTPAIAQARTWESLGIDWPLSTIVTSYSFGALTPFAGIAVDLLVKPFGFERLEIALALAKAQIHRTRQSLVRSVFAEPALPLISEPRLQRLAVQAEDRVVLIKTEDIEWIQAAGKFVRIHSAIGPYLLRRSLKSLELALDPHQFLRVHRNVLINLDHVVEFHIPETGNMLVKLRNGTSLPLRKSTRQIVRRLLENRI